MLGDVFFIARWLQIADGNRSGESKSHWGNIWIPTKALDDDRDCYIKDNQASSNQVVVICIESVDSNWYLQVVYCRNGLPFQDSVQTNCLVRCRQQFPFQFTRMFAAARSVECAVVISAPGALGDVSTSECVWWMSLLHLRLTWRCRKSPAVSPLAQILIFVHSKFPRWAVLCWSHSRVEGLLHQQDRHLKQHCSAPWEISMQQYDETFHTWYSILL